MRVPTSNGFQELTWTILRPDGEHSFQLLLEVYLTQPGAQFDFQQRINECYPHFICIIETWQPDAQLDQLIDADREASDIITLRLDCADQSLNCLNTGSLPLIEEG